MRNEQLSPEQELLVRLARLYGDTENDRRIEALLKEPRDWNYLIVQAAKHKVLQLTWDNLLKKDFVDLAIRHGGLTKLWTVYLSQLYVMNRERNRIYVTNVEQLAPIFHQAGLRLVVLKGAALIGDLYTNANRMLHDVDLLGTRDKAEQIKACFFEQGYQYGVYESGSESIKPLDPKLERFWIFQNHTLPSFYRRCPEPFVGAYKIQVGFNFFDNHDAYSFGSANVLKHARLKTSYEQVFVPSHEHMLINLCCHIYREGISMNYADSNDNFQLTKFCDLYSYLQHYGDQIDRRILLDAIEEADISNPYYYALYYTHQVYRDPLLKSWLELVQPEDTSFLYELKDGKKVQVIEEPFYERLFSLKCVRADPQGGWNRYVDRDLW